MNRDTTWDITADVQQVLNDVRTGVAAGSRLVLFVGERHDRVYDQLRTTDLLRQLNNAAGVSLVLERTFMERTMADQGPNVVSEPDNTGWVSSDPRRDVQVVGLWDGLTRQLPPGERDRPTVVLFGDAHFAAIRRELDQQVGTGITLVHVPSIGDQVDALPPAPLPAAGMQRIGFLRPAASTCGLKHPTATEQDILDFDALMKRIVPNAPLTFTVYAKDVFPYKASWELDNGGKALGHGFALYSSVPAHLAVAAALPNDGEGQVTITQASVAQITGRLESLV
jgi:hypothetical protein